MIEALPDQWEHSMNFWDPESASCDTPQDDFDSERQCGVQCKRPRKRLHGWYVQRCIL